MYTQYCVGERDGERKKERERERGREREGERGGERGREKECTCVHSLRLFLFCLQFLCQLFVHHSGQRAHCGCGLLRGTTPRVTFLEGGSGSQGREGLHTGLH